MEKFTILLRKNGSIKVPGPLIYVDEEGNETRIDKELVSLCRCGKSSDMPFCDHTHKAIEFTCASGSILIGSG